MRFLAIASLALGAVVAHGSGTRITMSAITVGDSDSFNINTGDLSASASVFATGIGGSAGAGVTVGMGEIHAQTSATVDMGPGYTSRTTVSTGATDSVLATSSNGTNVAVRWFLPISGSGTGFGEGLEDGTFSFFTQSFHDNQGVNYRLQISNGVTTYNSYFGNNGDQNFVDVVYQSGQSYVVALTFDATITEVGTNGVSEGSLDFGNTAHAYAQVLTAGATLTSASGHDYAAPVPEPASCAALGLGALGLVRRRRRGLGV